MTDSRTRRSSVALTLLAAILLVLSGCAKYKVVPTYATEARVECGGKQTLKAKFVTRRARTLPRFSEREGAASAR
jgi:phosphate transport system substrate-binding protein